MIATYEHIESENMVVWFNGQNITGMCAQFEKLFTQDTAYWGSVWVLVRMFGMVGQPFDGPEVEFTKATTRGAVLRMRGIIQWHVIDHANFGLGGLVEEDNA